MERADLAMRYYDPSPIGDTRWFTWPIVLWMTIIVWIGGQLILTVPLPFMLGAYDPEGFARLFELFDAETARPKSLFERIGTPSLVVGTLTGGLGLLAYFLGGREKGALWIAMIGIFLTFFGLVPFFMSSAEMTEANELVLSVIGLSPFAYMLMLLTFPVALIGLYWGWTRVHKGTLRALHTTAKHFRWLRVAQSFLIMWIVLGLYGLTLSQFTDNAPQFVFDAARFVPYAILSLLLLPVQSATEEIVVRGYMNKAAIRFLGNKWVAFILTSGLFMALHLANPEASAGAASGNLPIVMSGYFFFGFAACLMVLIDDGLESAIGVHAANNTFAAIFVNYENSVLPTPSIWQVRAEPTGDAISTILILSIVLGLLYLTRQKNRDVTPATVGAAD